MKDVKFAAEGLSAEQKERLQEVADLLLGIYQTLVEMRYVHPTAVIRGPHKLNDDILAGYAKCELDSAIVYLYSIMPYIDGMETDAQDFFQGGAFFSQMSIAEVEQGRDPRYMSPKDSFDDEHGQYMYPWYTPLSNCGNHSPIIIYDAKEHRIWMVEQIDGYTTDPAYCKGWYGDVESAEEGSNWGDSGSSSWSGDGSAGSSEFWDDEDDIVETQELDATVADQAEVVEYDEGFEQVEELEEWERKKVAGIKNQNSLEFVRSRPAGDVLRDINRWYRELKELPGQGEYNGWMEPSILKPLYLKNGWGADFDGDMFEVDMARAYATEKARYEAEEPLRQVDCYAGWAEYSERDVERYKKEISEAKTLDVEWKARFELWKAKERSERNAKDLKEAKAKAEKMCPNGVCQKDRDLPLWQLEKLRVETQWKRETAQRTNHQNIAERHKDDPERMRHITADHRRAQRELEIYEKAFKASSVEANCLCPGRTFEEATGIKSLGRQDTLTWIATFKKVIESSEHYIQRVRDFADVVPPQDTPETMAAIESEIKQNEESMKRSRDMVEQSERRLIEHGNTD